jgi:hypothetical protein
VESAKGSGPPYTHIIRAASIPSVPQAYGKRLAFAALEIASPEMALGLHVADHRFDGGAPSEFAFDEAEDAALLTPASCASSCFVLM